jgi:hypothetical protein
MATFIYRAVAAAAVLASTSVTDPAKADILRPGESLGINQVFNGDGGLCKMVLQPDGNMRMLRRDGRVVWETGTKGSGAVTAIMQHDGNFVLYAADGRAVWSTQTQGPNRVFGIEYTGRAVIMMPWKGVNPERYAQARSVPELAASGGKYQWRTYPNPHLC